MDNAQDEQPKKFLEKAAEELDIKLPKSQEPLGVKIIALLFLISGLSLVTAIITDSLNGRTNFGGSIFRLLAGIGALLIAYGLVKKYGWALILLGLFTIFSALINVGLFIFLLLLLGYLIFNRHLFAYGSFTLAIMKKLSLILRGNNPGKK